MLTPWLSDLLLYSEPIFPPEPLLQTFQLTKPVNTSLVTVYDTAHSYESSAGVGPFNSSLVAPFIKRINTLSPGYPYQVLPFSIYAAVSNLVANPWFTTVMDPVQCSGPHCESYLLSGGALLMEPWIPPGYESTPFIKIDGIPTVQLEYTPISTPPNHTHLLFNDTECQDFGNPSVLIALRLCVAASPSPGALNAGLFVCLNGTDPTTNNKCRPNGPEPTVTPNITTTLTLFSRKATIIFAQSNLSIVSVSDLSPPTPLPITLDDLLSYGAAMAYLLNFTAANIPAPSSIVESFWSGSEQLHSGPLSHSFQSILAFPIWLFNANNYGNLDIWDKKTKMQNLPGEFHTKASIVMPYVKIKFDPAMVTVFVVLQGATLVFLWGLLCWSCFVMDSGSMPVISSYPLFDTAFKTEVEVPEASQGEIWGAQNGDVLRMMKGRSVTVKRD